MEIISPRRNVMFSFVKRSTTVTASAHVFVLRNCSDWSHLRPACVITHGTVCVHAHVLYVHLLVELIVFCKNDAALLAGSL